jgi:hypothetical protein
VYLDESNSGSPVGSDGQIDQCAGRLHHKMQTAAIGELESGMGVSLSAPHGDSPSIQPKCNV